MSGGGGGAGGGLITDGNARLLVEDDVAASGMEGTTDANEQPLFDWGTDVASPSISAGASLGHWSYQYRLTWGQESYLHADQAYLGPGPVVEPVWTQHALWWVNKSVRSTAGTMNVHHADTPSAWACGLGLGSSGGWREDEWWTRLASSLPTAPANVAGILVTITLADLDGAATGGIVYVRGSAPTVGRSGTPVATIGAGATQVLIPYAALDGDEVWLGVGPAWQADYHYTTATHGLGDEGACVGGYTSGNGTLRVSAISAATWAVYSSTAPDFGATVVLDPDGEDETPWEGGNTIEDAGIEGSPSATGVSGGALYVTGVGGRCVMVRGDTEDEDEPWGPWAGGWSYQFPFEADILASGGEIEVTTTRGGMTTTGTIYLDSTPSVKVATPSSSAEVTVAIGAGERWVARFDDRSGYFRAKVWEQSDGEPTDWAVSIALPEETDDVGDRVVLCVRAGTAQTVQVFAVAARAAAPATWVRERLGIAPGTTDEFPLSHPHVTGTLWFDIGGSFVPSVREVSGTGWIDYTPTAGMVVWANYLSD